MSRTPKYIVHQGREFYCIRRNPGITAQRAKWRAAEPLEDRKFARSHVRLDMRLSWLHESWYRPAYKRFAEKRAKDLR